MYLKDEILFEKLKQLKESFQGCYYFTNLKRILKKILSLVHKIQKFRLCNSSGQKKCSMFRSRASREFTKVSP